MKLKVTACEIEKKGVKMTLRASSNNKFLLLSLIKNEAIDATRR